LQQGLAAGADHQPVVAIAGPGPGHGIGQIICRGEFAAAGPVGADEIGVAKGADSAGAILLASAPQVAARESAEHGSATGLTALALKRQENLFYTIGHAGV
jgi:hypothetical protein